MKKKILFVINSMGCGGAEKSLLSLLSLLDYDRYDVTLQMFRRGGMFENLIPAEVKIREDLDYTKFCSKSLMEQMLSFDFKRVCARICTSLFLRKNAKDGYPLHDAQAYWKHSGKAFDKLAEQYDAAIAWGQGNPTHFVTEKVAAAKKYAWVNVNYEDAGHNRDFDRGIYAEYNGIVCVSDKLKEMFIHVFPEYADRCSTIFDIQNAALIEKMALEKVELTKYGTTLVTVGRLVPQKGYDISAEAAKILKERGVEFHWYIVGDGDRESIEADIVRYGIDDCFTLLGAKANPYPYMKAADIYVQTSKFEGYCLTLAEARMLNIPCVTTAFDVVYDQMIDGENGLVVDMNAQAVANGIERLMNDADLNAHIKDYQMREKKGNIEEIEKFYRLVGE